MQRLLLESLRLRAELEASLEQGETLEPAVPLTLAREQEAELVAEPAQEPPPTQGDW